MHWLVELLWNLIDLPWEKRHRYDSRVGESRLDRHGRLIGNIIIGVIVVVGLISVGYYFLIK